MINCLRNHSLFLLQAFVYNYNVYLYDLKENIDSQITFDGNRDLIHNGLIEWIYECKREMIERNSR